MAGPALNPNPDPAQKTQAMVRALAAGLQSMADAEKRIDQKLQQINQTEQTLRELVDSFHEQASRPQEIEVRVLTALRDAERSLSAREAALNAHLSKVQQSVDAATAQIQSIVDPLTRRISEIKGPMEDEVDVALESFARRGKELLAANRRDLDEQLTDFASNVSLETQPMLNRLDQARASADAQLRSATDIAVIQLRRYCNDLTKTAQTVAEDFEQRLVHHVRRLEAQSSAGIDAIEKSMTRQVEQITKRALEAVEQQEARLVGRVSRLEPRLVNELRVVGEQIEQQATVLERQTQARVEQILALPPKVEVQLHIPHIQRVPESRRTA